MNFSTLSCQKLNLAKRISRKAIIIIIIIAILVIMAVLASVYGIFLKKTAKELYISSEAKTFENTIKGIRDKYEDDLALQKAIAQGPSQMNLEISGDINIDDSVPSYERDQLNTIKQTLKDSKLTITASSDPLQQVSDTVLSLVLKGSDLLNAELILSEEKIGVKVPELSDKYFQVNPDNFGEAARKIDSSYSGPEKLDLNQYSLKNLNLTKDDWTRIGTKYAKFLNSNLQEECFTLEKGVPYNSPDGEKKLRQLTIKMNEEQTKDLMNKLINELANDSEMQDLLTKNLLDLSNASMLTGYNSLTNSAESSLEVKKEIINNLEQLKNELQNARFPNGLTMVILIDSEENIVSRQFDLTLIKGNNDDDDGLIIKLESKNWDSKNTHKTSSVNLVLGPTKEKDSTLNLNLNLDTAREKNSIIDQYNGSCTITDRGRKVGDITLKINNLSSPKKDDKRQCQSDFELCSSNDVTGPLTLKGKINRTVEQNLAKKYSNQDLGITLTTGIDGSNNGQNVDFSLNLKNNIVLIDEVQIPSLTAGNSVDMAIVSQSELSKIMEEVQSLMEKFYYQK